MAWLQDGPDESELLFDNLFFIHKLVGLFPFKMNSGKWEWSPVYLLISILVFGVECFLYYAFDRDVGDQSNGWVGKFITYLPQYVDLILIPIQVYWLLRNTQCLNSVLFKLRELINSTNYSVNLSWRNLNIFIVALIFEQIYEYCTLGMKVYIGLCPCRVLVPLKFLIAYQYLSLILFLTGFYKYLHKNINRSNAESFVAMFEQLTVCCDQISFCYTPQVLLASSSAFLYYVVFTYRAVMQFKDEGFFNGGLVAWACVNYIGFLYGTFVCRQAVLQGEEYSRKLYRLALDDTTMKLLNSERVLAHFKAEHSVQFSFLDLFNLDYSVIWTIVASASSYIVILVQLA